MESTQSFINEAPELNTIPFTPYNITTTNMTYLQLVSKIYGKYCENLNTPQCWMCSIKIRQKCLPCRPVSVRNCSSDLCDVQWRLGAWRPCTVVCGSGFQSRRVDCVHRRSGMLLTDQHCAWLQRPSTWQHCNTTTCGGKCLCVCVSNTTQRNLLLHWSTGLLLV